MVVGEGWNAGRIGRKDRTWTGVILPRRKKKALTCGRKEEVLYKGSKGNGDV